MCVLEANDTHLEHKGTQLPPIVASPAPLCVCLFQSRENGLFCEFWWKISNFFLCSIQNYSDSIVKSCCKTGITCSADDTSNKGSGDSFTVKDWYMLHFSKHRGEQLMWISALREPARAQSTNCRCEKMALLAALAWLCACTNWPSDTSPGPSAWSASHCCLTTKPSF